MSKYLIQDIIPPEKRRRKTASPADTLVKEATPTVEPEIVTHASRPIESTSGKPRPTLHRALREDPRTMITKELDAEPEAKARKKKQTEPKEEPAPETGETKNDDDAAWPYDIHSEESRESGHSEADLSPKEGSGSSFPPANTTPPRYPEYPMGGEERHWMRAWLPWILGVIILGGAAFFLLDMFAKATVLIVPKREIYPLDQKFTALKTPGEEGLAYTILVETASSSAEVNATGEKTVTAKASGKIVVYNEQTNTQRLIKNTRFQAPTGKIYRITDSIVIPKATLSAGKLKPGTLEVTVYADEAGPSYNSEPTDFTVPGLKSTTIFEKVYARSKGPITGGASGTIKTVSDQDLKQASENIKISLETKLRAKVRGDLTPSQIVYEKGIVITIAEPALSKASASAQDKAVVAAEGKAYAILFKRDELMRAIGKAVIPSYQNEAIEVMNLENIEFSATTVSGDALLSGTKLEFALKGDPEFGWLVDANALKQALAGIPKDNFNGVLGQYPAILRAKANVRPMWKGDFPKDLERIAVEIVDKMPE